MITVTLQSTSAAETQSYGRSIGKFLKEGDVVLLLANLGSGKTTFVQGLAKSLKIKEAALSPTFTIAQTLKGNKFLHHLDFYRMSKQELLAMGVQDYLNGQGLIDPGITVIEWAERFPEIWPDKRLEIQISILPKQNQRKFVFKAHGDDISNRLRVWRKSVEK